MQSLNEERIAELGEIAEIPALDEKDWHDFRIGDLFGISRPVARNKDNYLPGDVPFIASGSINNGVMKLCEPLEDEQLDDGCCITVSPVDGSTFFQPMNFLGRGGAGSSILMLRCEGLNLYRGQFMARTIQQTCSKYTYGHMGNKDSIKRERIMLPVTDSGEPDYAYMAEYVQQKRNAMLAKYRTCVEARIAELGEVAEIPALDEKEWKHFYIPDLFSKIQRGKRLKNADHIPGKIPYVSSTANNNGVDDYVEISHGARVFKNCISLANSGSVGTAFYEPFSFVASDHITSLKMENGSKFVYLFLVAVIEKQSSNFNFNREINDLRIKKMQVMLPVNDSGKPDYAYMEQYAKNMMLRKYRQYLAYLDRQKQWQE